MKYADYGKSAHIKLGTYNVIGRARQTSICCILLAERRCKKFCKKEITKRSLYEEEKSFCCSTVFTHDVIISCIKLGETAKYGREVV